MDVAENPKLIYQLSRIYKGQDDMGVIYQKHPLLEISSIYNIWAKRAVKKGYLKIMEETQEHWLYKLTKEGLELLKKHKQYYLQLPNDYSMFNVKKQKNISIDEDIKRQKRRERRRLRKLKLLGRS